MSVLGCSLLLAIFAISGTVSLKCYRCSDVQNTHKCKHLETCSEGQVCYKRREFTHEVQFDLGCIDAERCGAYADIKNVSENAKMIADEKSYCYECCSNEKCNKDLCDHPPPSLCQDNESVDCAQLNSMFSICKVTNEAKKICPRFCKLCDLVDGKWAPWTPWSSCDVTCGKGKLSRHRSCNNPAPQNGGLDCPGKGTEIKSCILRRCPVHGGWSSWGNWGKCSATCGVGMRSRKRSCTNPRPERFGDHCFDDSTGYELCNNGFCTGVWEDWQAWDNCNVECGRGTKTRKRTCIKKDLFTGNCIGNATDVKTCEGKCYTDCYDIRKYSGKQKSGVYNVTLWKTREMVPVYCDFDTDSGGWTVFQYRFNGNVNFYRHFMEYKTGFGSLNGEFWLGLEYMYEMVSQGKSELRLDLTSFSGQKAYETFQNFQLDKGPYYNLRIDKGVGTAGDDTRHGLSYHNGQNFTTYDQGGSCANRFHGGWWYKGCFHVNLNGPYPRFTLYFLFNHFRPIKITRMMFRRV